MSSCGLKCLPAESAEGQACLADLDWAIEYAMQNRLAMAAAVEAILRSLFDATLDWSTLIHCQHNHVRRESHAGRDLWVHRKGALTAGDAELGIIPGSMGTRSFHVAGRGNPQSFCSSSHGAGRAMPRHVALKRISRHNLQRQMRGIWYDHRRGDSLRDEAPDAYKDITRVMRAQRDLTRITRELRPLLVYKGG